MNLHAIEQTQSQGQEPVLETRRATKCATMKSSVTLDAFADIIDETQMSLELYFYARELNRADHLVLGLAPPSLLRRRLGGRGRPFPRRPVRTRRGIHKYWRSSTISTSGPVRAARVKGFSISKSDFAGGRLSLLPANVSGHSRLRSTYDRALTAQSVEERATRKTGC